VLPGGRISRYSFCPTRAEGLGRVAGGVEVVAGVSGLHAAKTGNALAAYNRAASAAEQILAVWNEAAHRRDATLAVAAASAPDAPERIRAVLRNAEESEFSVQELTNRFDQFEEESNILVPAAMDALERGDFAAFGSVADRSQDLAERLLGNQTPETIHLARSARELGAAAASAFGAGFGGSVWALVRAAEAAEFIARWSEHYARAFPARIPAAQLFASRPGPAATHPHL
jgi:Mevalonate kinase